MQALKVMQEGLGTPSGKPRELVKIASVSIGEAHVTSG